MTNYKVDDRVKVVMGPLKGDKGIVTDTELDTNDDTLFVQVQFDDESNLVWVDAVILEKD
jgi:ribosomal protein L24